MVFVYESVLKCQKIYEIEILDRQMLDPGVSPKMIYSSIRKLPMVGKTAQCAGGHFETKLMCGGYFMPKKSVLTKMFLGGH